MSPTPWPSWRRQGCGTEAAYRRHLRNGEIPDQACTEAATRACSARRRFREQQRARKAEAA